MIRLLKSKECFILAPFALVALVAFFIADEQIGFTSPLCRDRQTIEIVKSLRDHSEDWKYDGFYMTHRDGGFIWVANAAYAVSIVFPGLPSRHLSTSCGGKIQHELGPWRRQAVQQSTGLNREGTNSSEKSKVIDDKELDAGAEEKRDRVTL